MKTVVAILVLAICVALLAWERKVIASLSVESNTLRAEKLEAEQLANENRELPGLRENQQAGLEPGGNVELLRLRNEVRQLRAQHAESEKLRGANQRLTEELKSGHFTPRRLADMDGTVPREKWIFAGFATPEAAIQSFFAGVVTGDPEQLIRCMSPQAALDFRNEFENDPKKVREEIAKEFGKLGQASGFRITGSRNTGDNKIEILVQVAADGQSMPLPLSRINQEWKIGE
jgi:hypothetical protein